VAPRVSVVVPTYRRPAALARCLDALAALDPPPGGFEVVVGADGEDAADPAVVAAHAGAVPVRLVVRPNGGPGAARNTAAAAADGELLAFTDDDCLPEPGWLVALERRLRERPGAVVGGRVVNALSGNLAATASQLVMDVVREHFAEDAPASFFTSNNLAVDAAVFARIGGFDERLRTAEDRELCDRARRAGHALVPAPEAVVGHAHDLTPAGLVRQHLAYGRGAIGFAAVRAARGQPPLAVDRRFHPRLVRTAWRRGGGGARGAALTGLVVLTQAAYAAGILAEAAQRARRAGRPAAGPAPGSPTVHYVDRGAPGAAVGHRPRDRRGLDPRALRRRAAPAARRGRRAADDHRA
jgi:GT2 family glycosyltransferase